MFNLPYIKQYIFKYRSARGDHLQLQVQDMSGDGNKRKRKATPKMAESECEEVLLDQNSKARTICMQYIVTRLAIIIDTYME